MKKHTLVVVDGKGGGLGRAIVEALLRLDRTDLAIAALGTNAAATGNMLAGGAKDGATGENAICCMAVRADVILGPMAILVADAMMGEITPRMAQAIAQSPAPKILLPMQRCGVRVLGASDAPVRELLAGLGPALEELLDGEV